MTYILEKSFAVTSNFKIIQDLNSCIYIRPCEWSYRKCSAFWSGKLKNVNSITFLGACAVYDCEQQFQYKSLEEWLINLNLEKNISLDFEEHVVIDNSHGRYDSYIMKIIDLHTNKVIEDNTEKIIAHLKSKYLI